MNITCALFEKQLYRVNRCKHCFRSEDEHSVSLHSTKTSISSSPIKSGNSSNSNINNNSSNNKSSSSSNSTNKEQVPVPPQPIARAPLSIRRSLTPVSIETYKNFASKNFGDKEKSDNKSPTKPITVPSSSPINISSGNSNNTTPSNSTPTTPTPLSNSPNHRPLPPTPLSPGSNLLKNKLPPPPSIPGTTTSTSAPTSICNSANTTPALNSSEPIAIPFSEDDDHFSLNNSNNSSNSSNNRMIDIPINITRPLRSHSDSPTEFLNVKTSQQYELNNSNSNILSPTGKRHARNLSGSSSSGNTSVSPSPMFLSSTNSTPPLSSSPNFKHLNNSTSSLQSSGGMSHSSSNGNLSGSSQLIPPGSPGMRKYSIAKNFIKLKQKSQTSPMLKKNSTSNIHALKTNAASSPNLSTPPLTPALSSNHYYTNEQNKIYYAIESIIRSLPGISNHAVYNVMEILANQQLDIDYNTLINPNHLESLNKASTSLTTWIETQDYLRDVIKVQSCVRRFLAKRRTDWLSQVYTKSVLKDRNIAFRQLIQLERRYNDSLNIIVNTYYKPLKQLNLLADMDIKSIFSSIEEIYYVHQRILLQFEELHRKWPTVEGLGDIFLRIAPELKVYGNYVKNFKNAIDTLNTCQEENYKFSQFLKECCETTPGKVFDLMALIATPLNHLSFYERQLFSIANCTPQGWPTEPDYVNIINSVTMMKEVEQLVQDNLAQAQNAATLMNIYRRVNNKKALDPFVIPGRTFIHEGKLTKFETKKQDQIYYYYLCSDIILFVKKSNQPKELYKFKNIFNLSDVVVSDLHDTQLYKNIISIINNSSKENYTFSIEDNIEKQELMKQFSTLCTININKSTKLFGGVSLAEISSREGGNIPTFIVKSCESLLNWTECEGLFRISPNQSEIDTIKQNLNNCTTPFMIETIISKCTGHQLAAILKTFFRELTNPLLTFELFDPIIQVGDDHTLEDEEQIEKIKTMIQNIPKVNQMILQMILLLLITVAKNSEKNKMTHSNLAIVFGPNLIKPHHQTIESSLKIPIINNVITNLLENYNILYQDRMNTIKIQDSKFVISQ